MLQWDNLFIIGPILSAIGIAILSLELLISSQFWSIAIHTGLESSSTFLFFKNFPVGISVLDGYITQLLPLILLVCAVYSAIQIMISREGRLSNTLDKVVVGVIVFLVSFTFLPMCLFLLQEINLAMLSLSPHWAYYFSENYMISNLNYFGASKNTMMEILLDGIYLTSSTSILFFLMLREAILILLYLFLPVFSIFFPISYLGKIIERLWILFVQILVSPFIIILIIYLYISFTGNYFAQMGFLLLLTLLPTTFIYTAYRIGGSRGFGISGPLMWSGAESLAFGLSSARTVIQKQKESSVNSLRKSSPDLYLGNLSGLINRRESEDGGNRH